MTQRIRNFRNSEFANILDLTITPLFDDAIDACFLYFVTLMIPFRISGIRYFKSEFNKKAILCGK